MKINQDSFFYTGPPIRHVGSCGSPYYVTKLYGPIEPPPPTEPRYECVGGHYDSLCVSELEGGVNDRLVYIDQGYDNDGGDTHHAYRLVDGKLVFEGEEFIAWDDSGSWPSVDEDADDD